MKSLHNYDNYLNQGLNIECSETPRNKYYDFQ